jgi:hypothetical protein
VAMSRIGNSRGRSLRPGAGRDILKHLAIRIDHALVSPVDELQALCQQFRRFRNLSLQLANERWRCLCNRAMHMQKGGTNGFQFL